MGGYNPSAIEKKWQKVWAEQRIFAADGSDRSRPKFYVLDMFPYPSGQGLHVGHPEGYTATDIVARYKRGRGFNVMHPMGWDAFGLPAEQYAIKEQKHPGVFTQTNINKFRGQLQALGFSYDWEREVDTTDPGYYRWTQWIFLKLYDTWFDEVAQKGRPISELVEEFERKNSEFRVQNSELKRWREMTAGEKREVLAGYRLAYEAEVPVNWCPGLGTVLANEEVIDGKSEVGGFPVERRPMRQWMLRITAYAERLIAGLEKLEWSDSLKEMQRNWIGKSEGAEVEFKIPDSKYEMALPVFTTRPDTLFGATYMVMAPEHPFVDSITTDAQRAKVAEYKKWASSRSDRERQEDTTKTGEFTGAYAVNPVNGERIPIWVSDYVLMGYGTGAIMAVPGHDERDHEFARKFGLPIVRVVQPPRHQGTKEDTKEDDIREKPFVEEGVAVNSAWIEGLGTAEAKEKMITLLEVKGIGRRRVNYKIRDWLFSRQRYWGEPFPIVHLEDGTSVRLADSELPVVLPELADFRPTGTIEPPLSKARGWKEVFVTVDKDHVACVVSAGTAGAVKGRRELNTMPQWAGSCWYYLRYLDPKNEKAFVDAGVEKYWMGNGVDLYVGGVEHAVLHLLYSRFWHKVLFDWGLVSCEEPFRKLVNQGLILGEPEFTVFRDEEGDYISAHEVQSIDFDGNSTFGKWNGNLVRGENVASEAVEKKGEGFVLKGNPAIRVDSRSFKMAKSRGNVVNPDDVIREYGADSLRMFEMFMGPLEQVKPWSTAGVEGVYRFLQRVWRNMIDTEVEDPIKCIKLLERHPEGKEGVWWTSSGDLAKEEHTKAELDYQVLIRPLHKTIKKVTEDIEKLSFNTAIAAMMEFNNLMGKPAPPPSGKPPYVTLDIAEAFLRILEPFAPHFADEVLGIIRPDLKGMGVVSNSQRPWPSYDPALLVESTIEVPVQVNGKLRGRVMVAADADEGTVIAAALADGEVAKFLAGKEVKKKIYVKGRMVNLVV